VVIKEVVIQSLESEQVAPTAVIELKETAAGDSDYRVQNIL